MKKNARIFITGNTDMFGAGIEKYLRLHGFGNIVTDRKSRVDFLKQGSVFSFFQREKPEYVFLTAARSGGIMANTDYPADLMFANLEMQNNVIHYASLFKTKKLLLVASSCVYPEAAPQPIKENSLLSGRLEEISAPYAVSRIAGIKLCQAYSRQYRREFISVIPATVYGPQDKFDPRNSHVLSALLVKFHDARVSGRSKVMVWGSGRPRREFIHIDDLADACVYLMDNYSSPEVINAGTGFDTSIKDLAFLIRDIVGYKGRVVFDRSKPDGALRKLLDCRKIKKLGWRPKVALEQGIRLMYQWYQMHHKTFKLIRSGERK